MIRSINWQVVVLMAATVASFLWLVSAFAHDDGPGSWINHQNLKDPVTGQFCCNLYDCKEADEVRAIPDGFLIASTGEVIDRQRVIWKSPGGWWRCEYIGGPMNGKTRCLIGPPQGS